MNNSEQLPGQNTLNDNFTALSWNDEKSLKKRSHSRISEEFDEGDQLIDGLIHEIDETKYLKNIEKRIQTEKGQILIIVDVEIKIQEIKIGTEVQTTETIDGHPDSIASNGNQN